MTIPADLAEHPLIRKLQAFHPRAVTAAGHFRGQLCLEVPADLIREVCEFLRRDPELEFNLLVDITAVDRFPLEPRFEVVYFLRAMKGGQRLRLKTKVGGGEPALNSVVSLWPAADMLEREVFDLFGIRFTDHPHLRRLLMPDDWQGHPLRKDYPMEGHQ